MTGVKQGAVAGRTDGTARQTMYAAKNGSCAKVSLLRTILTGYVSFMALVGLFFSNPW